MTDAEGDAALPGPTLPMQGPSSKPFWVTLKKNKSTPKSMSKKEKVCCAEFEQKSQQASQDRQQRKKKSYPLGKTAFVWSSSDDNFQ